jgi:hypothetical protein
VDAPGLPALDSVVARAEKLAWQNLAEQAVILDPERGMLRGLNASAWAVWQLIDGQRTLAEIGRAVAQTFGVDERRAIPDVLTFARALHERSLVVVPGERATGRNP